jgi:hypothetical protein
MDENADCGIKSGKVEVRTYQFNRPFNCGGSANILK